RCGHRVAPLRGLSLRTTIAPWPADAADFETVRALVIPALMSGAVVCGLLLTYAMRLCALVHKLVIEVNRWLSAKSGAFIFSREEGVGPMSLTVPQDLLGRAQDGPVPDAEFIECIRTSLPYAWSVVTDVAEKLSENGGRFADNQTQPPDEDTRGQLLRLVASDAMRAGVERHFGVRVAFQNCHRLAMFGPNATELYNDFVTPRAQLLNQRPEFVNC